MSTTTQQRSELKKKTLHVFSKDIYLLGRDKDGVNYWLEAPSWDCGWYWGFGYVETYTNNGNPEKAQDISSHQHIDTFFKRGENISLWHTQLHKHAYTGSEASILAGLFSEYYALKAQAGSLHDNDYNCNSFEELNKVTPSNESHANWLSLVTTKIPLVMNQIVDILSPSK